jgi:predicted cupin superfamily sugar epimerase
MSRDGPFEALVERLGLKPHPEGGWYAETWREPAATDERSAGTAIYYALTRGQSSHWHRVDATEIWHFYDGDPLVLSLFDGQRTTRKRLGPISFGDCRPQVIVPRGVWQSVELDGDGAYALVGCTVAPGFEFSGFELAPPGWTPDR